MSDQEVIEFVLSLGLDTNEVGVRQALEEFNAEKNYQDELETII